MKWSRGRETLTIFPDEANNFHPSIKCTAEISNEQHVFLDIKCSLVDDKISVDLYTKPTDTHEYLLPTRCHLKHCCKNIPYSLALRLKRICSDARAKELIDHLCKQDYTTSANGVIRNRQFHLPLRGHGNRTEKTYFLIGLNLSRAFFPSC